jgi:phosphoglycerate dehydrogenase-like enzyme
LDELSDEASFDVATDARGLKRIIRDAEVLLVTDFRTDAVEEAWPDADNVKWIHATSAGVDKVLVPAVVDSDVPVTNARGIFDRSIADYVVGSVFFFAKDFAGNLRYQREHRWCHRETELVEDARMLVVGAGSVGRSIAQVARGVGMRVSGTASRARDDDPDFESVYASDDLLEVLPDADYVVIAAPLTDSTRKLFGPDAFAAMKSTARLVNIGRGPIVDTDALVDALESGGIAGAALDVFEQEPLPEGHPLWDMPNVMMSAHMAGDFIGWERALIDQFADNFRRWKNGDELFNEVDKKRGYGPRKEARK